MEVKKHKLKLTPPNQRKTEMAKDSAEATNYRSTKSFHLFIKRKLLNIEVKIIKIPFHSIAEGEKCGSIQRFKYAGVRL